ncbi:hypothetical protein P153DRAFT_306581 [Dothidotthia symphoricarpi CBS 119687]|uniref:Rhodopsin domain-containing protein n=1 Tax=Dothidotthia symphoricarpi CBS 119687 TaxID=1392245 RepID=A0A6A6AQU8_9PLEO|nr:uncharacterized protein P153DRAFT_306581 [Dothidotthia symphoricarpi CBS 119687]KAF2133916.1 hypothetical protein P153DRAFT_306581 [Dothidotthia symphoricarpi CBS 119687]
MIIGNIIVQFFGWLFFFARVCSRIVVTRSWKAEDYILTLGWLCVTGYSVCQYGQIANGAGRHIAATSMNGFQDPIQLQQYAYAAQLLLISGLAACKLSICLSYLRVFYSDVRGRRLIQILVAVILLTIIPFECEVIFQCKPINVYWTELRPSSKCASILPALYAHGSLNVAIDIFLMAIVLPRVLALKLHKHQRWALTGIVMLGSLAVVAGIVRMVRVGTSLARPDFEPSWDSYDVSIWTSTELYVSLICASAPGVKPVLVKLVPKLLGSSTRSRTRTFGGPSIEMGSRWRRPTIGSTNMKRPNSATMLATIDGPYTECGRGLDEESWYGRSSKTGDTDLGTSEIRPENGIWKTSETSVRSSTVR